MKDVSKSSPSPLAHYLPPPFQIGLPAQVVPSECAEPCPPRRCKRRGEIPRQAAGRPPLRTPPLATRPSVTNRETSYPDGQVFIERSKMKIYCKVA